MNTSFFSEMLQSIADRSRALIKRERREPAHERSAGIVELCEELLSGRGEASGVALAQEILARYARTDHRPAHRLFRSAGHHLRPRSAPASTAPLPTWRQAPTADNAVGTAPSERAAAARTVPPAQSRPRRHRGAGAHARAIARRHGASRRSRRHRQRFRPSVLVLVQSRLPGAAPDRLVDLGGDPGKDHPLRGGARDQRLGRSAPAHRSARPPLLRLLPSGAGRRAA